MHKTLLALAAAASATIAFPALAQSNTAAVRTADLNLATSDGRLALGQRIAAAAERVCFVYGDRSLAAKMDGDRCFNDAVQNAQRQVANITSGMTVASK